MLGIEDEQLHLGNFAKKKNPLVEEKRHVRPLELRLGIAVFQHLKA